jgi:hypothetical protein
MPQLVTRLTFLWSVLNIVLSLMCYILAVISLVSDKLDWDDWLPICFALKAVGWSPFIALEFYDTFFEHLYYDVAYQNEKLITSRTSSPL